MSEKEIKLSRETLEKQAELLLNDAASPEEYQDARKKVILELGLDPDLIWHEPWDLPCESETTTQTSDE